jgi:hypothetical protein
VAADSGSATSRAKAAKLRRCKTKKILKREGVKTEDDNPCLYSPVFLKTLQALFGIAAVFSG